MTTITESDIDQEALDWLTSHGWQVTHGPSQSDIFVMHGCHRVEQHRGSRG